MFQIITAQKCTAQTLTFLSCLLEGMELQAPSSVLQSQNLPPKSDSLKSESLLLEGTGAWAPGGTRPESNSIDHLSCPGKMPNLLKLFSNQANELISCKSVARTGDNWGSYIDYSVLSIIWNVGYLYCFSILCSQQGCEVGARYILAMKNLNLREGSTMVSASLSSHLSQALAWSREGHDFVNTAKPVPLQTPCTHLHWLTFAEDQRTNKIACIRSIWHNNLYMLVEWLSRSK